MKYILIEQQNKHIVLLYTYKQATFYIRFKPSVAIVLNYVDLYIFNSY